MSLNILDDSLYLKTLDNVVKLDRRFFLDIITPLGSEVVPDVNIM
jgi:hypothetical protein